MIRRLVAEALGTALLVAVVVGSGIMAMRLANGNEALALLANAIATGCGLLALLTAFGPVCGAHFNPAVSLALACVRKMRLAEALAYGIVQIIGAVAGVAAANTLFGLAPLQAATKVREGGLLWASEVLATAGLLLIIGLAGRHRSDRLPALVAAYITAAYWFTPSTSFANPAITIARAMTDTFTGIRPGDVTAFITAQVVGAPAGILLARWLVGERADTQSQR